MEAIATDPYGSVEEATKAAVAAAIEEGIIASEDQANIEILEEGSKGFIGIGRKPATVKVTRKPKRRRRRRRRKGEGAGEKPEQGERRSESPKDGQKKPQNRPQGGKNGGRSRQSGGAPKKEKAPVAETELAEEQDNAEEQAEMVAEFLTGLIGALGLEGDVTTRLEDGIIKADVTGEQTEVLVGAKGSMIRSVQELSRTVLQRKTARPRRVVVDIAGYGARRREALGIYAGRLAENVLEEGGEMMLEPMNAADRKVVHDAIAGIENVRSYSEGEDPRRCVVIAAVEGYEPPMRDEEE